MKISSDRSLNPLGISAEPAIPFTVRDRLTLFSDKTVTGVQPYAATLVSSAALLFISSTRIWGRGTDGYTNHLVASFTRRLVTYGAAKRSGSRSPRRLAL